MLACAINNRRRQALPAWRRTLKGKRAHERKPTRFSFVYFDGDPLARAWAYGTNNGLTETEMRERLELTQEQVDIILGKLITLIDEGSDKIISPEGDILTRMSRDSLTRIKDNAARALASAIARDDAENTAFFTLQLEAADGLLALIPTGGDVPVIGENATALGWKELIERTTSDPTAEGSSLFIAGLQLDLKTLQKMEINHNTDLGNFAGARLIDFPMQMSAGVPKTYTFHLTETAMVNLWTKGAGMHDVNLRISGGDIGFGYPSQKSGMNGGESISLKLTPGDYTFMIEDHTNYGSMYMGSYVGTADYKVTTGIEITPFNSANIVGKISIDGSSKVMPVSMRVANFKTDGSRNTDYDKSFAQGGVKELNTDQPVWVVIHGMNSGENKAIMSELTKALASQSQDVQVVTIDWSEAAQSVTTSDAKWTPAVGKWAAQQMINLGFHPNQVSVGGWSHGTFVGYEMGLALEALSGGDQIRTFVALDAARNVAALSGYTNQPNFAAISQQSIAFDSSLIAGDNDLANTADYSFLIQSDETDAFIRHRLAVNTFTSILNHEKSSPGSFSQIFSFERLMGDFDSAGIFAKNVFAGGFEGVIDTRVERVRIGDETYEKSVPTIMHIVRPHDDEEDTLLFDSIQA